MKTGDCGYILSSKCLEFVIVTFRIKKKLLKNNTAFAKDHSVSLNNK